jgi:hypothetical protein
MPAAEGFVETDRPDRYLRQLCRHGNQMRDHPAVRHHDQGDTPPQVRHAECSGGHGLIEFSEGVCTMTVTPDGLTLHAEARNSENLHRIQAGITTRIETMGSRENLTVTWHNPAKR